MQNRQRQERSSNEKALETWLISGVEFFNITSFTTTDTTQGHTKSLELI